jgi:fructose-specific component phosphotransferase system IIB-like protein
MPYTEKYPLNPTPQGDSTKEAVLKNREEIKTIGNALSAQSKSGGSGLRQRILYGKNSGGKYSFLSGDGLSVIIDGSVIPVVLTLADGFDENGAKDYVETINKKISAWTLPINAISYLFVERNNAGALSYGSVTTKPVFSASLPSGVATNTHVFNTLEQKMYMYNGTEWKNVVRVFAAAVTTNATGVTKIEYMNNAAAVEMTEAEKEKLSGIEDKAEVNQNAFSKVKIGNKELVAAVKQAVLELIAGDNIKITPDANGSKITIDIANKKEIFDPDNYYTKDKADSRYYREGIPLPVTYSNEVNFAGTADTIQFGFRDHDIKTYRFGNGMQGGLADITAKAFGGNLCSGSFYGTQQMNDWLRQHYKDDNVYACLAHRANEIVINGNKQWGTVLMSAYPAHDGRALIIQLFFANSNGLFYRYLNTPDEIDNTNNWYQIVGTNNENKLKIGNNYIWFA